MSVVAGTLVAFPAIHARVEGGQRTRCDDDVMKKALANSEIAVSVSSVELHTERSVRFIRLAFRHALLRPNCLAPSCDWRRALSGPTGAGSSYCYTRVNEVPATTHDNSNLAALTRLKWVVCWKADIEMSIPPI